MKRLFLLAILCISLSACTKTPSDTPTDTNTDDDEAVQYPQLIAAKWQQTADTVQYINGGQVTDTRVNSASKLYYQFNTDGTGQQIQESGSADLTFILNEKNIIITYPPADPKNQPTIMPGTIRLLNSTTMCLFFDDIDNNGTSKSTQVIWFKKAG